MSITSDFPSISAPPVRRHHSAGSIGSARVAVRLACSTSGTGHSSASRLTRARSVTTARFAAANARASSNRWRNSFLLKWVQLEENASPTIRGFGCTTRLARWPRKRCRRYAADGATLFARVCRDGRWRKPGDCRRSAALRRTVATLNSSQTGNFRPARHVQPRRPMYAWQRESARARAFAMSQLDLFDGPETSKARVRALLDRFELSAAHEELRDACARYPNHSEIASQLALVT